MWGNTTFSSACSGFSVPVFTPELCLLRIEHRAAAPRPQHEVNGESRSFLAALPLPCGLPCRQLIQQLLSKLPLFLVPARFLPTSQAEELPWIPAKQRPPEQKCCLHLQHKQKDEMCLARISPRVCLLANQSELGLLVSLLNKNAWQNSQGTFHLIKELGHYSADTVNKVWY